MPDSVSGLLLVDKPEGLTSHDVVDAVRRLLSTRRVGHTGTLDPAATGLLVLCVGRAGRLQSFLTGLPKSYTGALKFGIATDTYDREGQPIGEAHPGASPSREAVEAALVNYVGALTQSPPPFSAKKFGGKKFYELARKGEAVPDLPKAVTVRRFEITALEGDTAEFTVECSSGTYIRSLVHDLGRDLGVGAHLTALRRTSVGVFRLEDASTLPELDARTLPERLAKPGWIPLRDVPLPYPAITLLAGEAAKIARGHAVPVRSSPETAEAPWVRLLCGGDLIALGHLEALGRGQLSLARPKIVLKD